MRGITKRYGDGFEAVSDVDLDIADGEFVILVGPSGCGKSTLLRMIVGLEDISDGEMRIGGEVVNGKAPRAIVREPQAFLFDEPLSNLDAKLRVQMRTEIARVQKKYGTTTVYVTHDQTEAMTLGDRVAVLRKGVIQQVDTPRNLYNDPANLFVAGFIGSPAMNLLPGTLRGTTLELPFVTVELPERVARRLPASDGERRVIAGVRPEDFEDASLVSERDRDHGTTFRTKVDDIEWMGSELYAYLPYTSDSSLDETLDRLAEDLDLETSSGDVSHLVTRLDAESEVQAAGDAEIWMDARKLHLFDPETGEALTRRRSEQAAPTG